LSNYISSENLAHVYAPDLRGHGKNPKKRGDIDYITQLEDDIAELVLVIREKHPNAKLIIGGHSSGEGLTLRFAGSQYRNEADAYLLISPYLKYNAPATRINSGGWASAHEPRITGLSMLNSLDIRVLNHLPVIDFNMPEAYRDGAETLSYS
jgi:alpha-beta hydrolase superfamily lysophospholipase